MKKWILSRSLNYRIISGEHFHCICFFHFGTDSVLRTDSLKITKIHSYAQEPGVKMKSDQENLNKNPIEDDRLMITLWHCFIASERFFFSRHS